MTDFLVPLNVKQEFIPFFINPAEKDKYSIFSFKSTSDTDTPYDTKIHDNCAQLNIFPSSIHQHFNNDISNKLLYTKSVTSVTDFSKNKLNINYSDIINNLPGIQIREYIPSARLNIVLELFVTAINGIFGLFSSNKANNNNSPNDEIPIKYQFGRIWDTIKYTYNRFISSIGVPNFPDTDSFYEMSTPYKNLIMNFPYTLYYLLQQCYTSNIYEIPGITSTKELYSTTGTAGWLDANSSFNLGKIDFLQNIPLIGKLLNFALGNIGIDYMPWWKAESGAIVKDPKIIIEFDLFNDNLYASIANFIFVNTLIPQNRWIQYGIIRQSSSLYDVRLEGYNRLFACAGDFSVTYKGVLRIPSPEFYKRLFEKHLNPKCIKNKEKDFYDNSIFKIPDIYHVKLEFSSLLPANFNNYIFSISNNTSNLFKEVKVNGQITGGKANQCVQMFFNWINGIINDSKKYYNGAALENAKLEYQTSLDYIEDHPEKIDASGGMQWQNQVNNVQGGKTWG